MARWIVFAGFTALLVTGYFATFYEHGKASLRSVRFVEAELRTEAADVLKRSGATWADIKMEGQIAILTGTAPSEADRDDAKRDVRGAAGAGGPWWGGITQVRDSMEVAEPKKPYIWSAVRGTGGRISLRGYVPGQRYRQAIRAEARKLFPTGVEDQMVVAAGHPTGPWAETAIWSLRQLSQLQAGDARFVDAVITLRGQARDAATQAAIYKSAKALPRPYQGVAEVTLSTAVALPEAPSETTAAPAVLSSVQRLAAADCQKLIDQAMTNNTIEFASGSAKIKVASYKILDRMSETAINCGTLRFRVTGHTDGTSLEAGIDGLSQNRAEAVAVYMTGKGIARERLLTVGAGSSQPIGDNSTVEGQARNRRIEISVLP
jgi:OmpA-OmpF porin, OOP family